jgi:transposase
MKRILKQVVGIDVAQKELVVSIGRMYDDCICDIYGNQSFDNNKKGLTALLSWVKKLADPALDLRYVMEATGIYHERLAYFLDEKGYQLSVILPNKISNYFKTLEVKTITDKTASQAITRFGLERNLENWTRPNAVYKSLKQLCRERNQVVEERTMVQNHLHAELLEAEPNQESLSRIKKRIAFLIKQEKEIKADISSVIKKNEELNQSIKLIASIPGVGELTAACVIGETNGFELIRSKRQLASYAGFDIKEKQSGTSVKGKPKISKRGNKHLRKAMYMPSLSAIKHDDRFKAVFTRLVARHGIKMKAATAVQRKLLEMIYTIFKTGKPYNKNYFDTFKKEEEKVLQN